MRHSLLLLLLNIGYLWILGLSNPALGATRMSVDISTGWRFLRQDVAGAESFDYQEESGWHDVNVPHTWNVQDTFDDVSGYYRGIGWYRKQIVVPEHWKDKRIVLRFEAACSVATVWFNGQLLGQHKGSYLPFEFDVTPFVKLGGKNLVAVRVDNRWRRDVPTLERDYNVMGGLHREVSLIATAPVYIVSNKITTPKVSESEGVVACAVEISNTTSVPQHYNIVIEVHGPGLSEPIRWVSPLSEVSAGQTSSIKHEAISITNPKLWSPDEPNLYRVIIQLRVDDRVIDEAESPLGFRWFRFDPEKGFFLNGKQLKLRGVNRHDDYPGMGWALPQSRHIEDIKLVKAMGANFIRTAHYPQHPVVLDACDRLGLLVWEEIPFDGDGLVKGLALGADDFAQNLQDDFRKMIARDCNHPSIILWSLGNENLYGPSTAARAAVLDLTRKLHAIAHREDPSRLTTVAIDTPRHKLADEIGFTNVVDVVGYNVYAGWYPAHGSHVEDFLAILDGFRRRHPDKPLIVSEYGADMERGRHAESPKHLDISEEYGCRLHEFYWRAIAERSFVAGSLIWNVFDFASEDRGKDQTIPHLNQKGIFTYDRQPKDVYYLYRSLWTTDPMVYIVSHTWPRRRAGATSVRVYSNCDTVELFHNGKSSGKKQKDETYVWDISLNAGENELRAIGSCKGKSVTDTIRIQCD